MYLLALSVRIMKANNSPKIGLSKEIRYIFSALKNDHKTLGWLVLNLLYPLNDVFGANQDATGLEDHPYLDIDLWLGTVGILDREQCIRSALLFNIKYEIFPNTNCLK